MINAEDYEWIGIVNPEDVRPGAIFVTPLAFYAEGAWKPIALDARRQCFPNNGKAAISASNFPSNRIGQLWQFHLERNVELTVPRIHGYSYYLVCGELEPAPLAQIIDWTARVSHSFEVSDILEQGIAAKDCFCQRVYIYCHSRLYGPIRLELDSGCFKPYEYLQSSSTGEQPLFVWVYTVPEEGFLDLTNVHTRFTFLDESMLDTPVGKEDWSLLQVTIKRILEASNEALVDTENCVRLIDKHLHNIAHASSREGPFAIHLDPATFKRTQYIVSNQVERLQDLQAFIEQLPAEHPLLKIARTCEIQARSEEIERGAEALTQDKQERLRQLQGEIEGTEATLDRLQNAANEAQQRYELTADAFNTLERNMRERLVSLKQEPLRVLAELQVTSSLFPLLGYERWQSIHENGVLQSYPGVSQQSEQQVAVYESGIDWRVKDDTDLIIVRLQELHKRWIQVAQRADIHSREVRLCVAAFLAGLIPAVAGDAAIPVLRAVAQIISDGRFTLVPIPQTALTTLDLFGTIDSHRQVFVPSSAFADCIFEAQAHPDKLVIVILEGIDRVAGMPTYVPLIRQYLEIQQHQGTIAGIIPLNLFHPRALDVNDPYFKLAWFTWPHNILLAVTLDDDFNSLTLPLVCNRWLVHMEAELKHTIAPSQKTVPVYSEVSLEQWQTWEQEIRSHASNITSSLELTDPRQKALHSALTMLNFKEPDDVIEHTWPKQFQQNGEEVV